MAAGGAAAAAELQKMRMPGLTPSDGARSRCARRRGFGCGLDDLRGGPSIRRSAAPRGIERDEAGPRTAGSASAIARQRHAREAGSGVRERGLGGRNGEETGAANWEAEMHEADWEEPRMDSA